MELDQLRFAECDTCRRQPGTPQLCSGCLHNRFVIDALREKYFESPLGFGLAMLGAGACIGWIVGIFTVLLGGGS